MKNLVLTAATREARGKQVQNLRKEGKMPGILYGHGVKNISFIIEYKNFEKIYKEAGASSLVDFQLGDGKPVKVLIQEVQRDPVSGVYIHVDLHQVKMTEKISTEVEIKFIGESPAVKEAGGILVKNITAMKIECLPEDLIHEIIVDISSLKTFADVIRVRDLRLNAKIEIKAKPDEVVANVQPPRTEEELSALEEKVEEKVEEVAKAGEEKKEEGEEGEAAPAVDKAASQTEEKKEAKKEKKDKK